MLRRRTSLPVLAEIAGAVVGSQVWSLRRQDFASLEVVLPQLAERRVVLVSGQGEPASVAALALAAAASSAGRRTILVECDLAKPRLAAQVGLAAAPGLHEYLRWEAEPADVIRPVVLGGPAAGAATEPLVCVCAGRPSATGETLLGLQSFVHMMEKLRGAYELVLLGGPPVEEDPQSCAAAAIQADAVIAGLPAAAATGREGRSIRAAINRLPILTLGTIAVGA
ncbi:MAG: hypothetical protein ACJ76D_00935 [Solirubrobacterales bacterium]